MANTSFIALGIALSVVGGLVVGLGALNLLIGAVDTLFGKASLKVLKCDQFPSGFAFVLRWSSSKEPAKIDTVQIRLFNPEGRPTQLEVKRSFAPESSSFAMEVDMGKSYLELLSAQGFDTARIQVELYSSVDGISFQFEYPGSKFRSMIENANQTVASLSVDTTPSKAPIDIPARSFISDTVPGQGAQLAIATNPTFEAYFKSMGSGGANAGAVEEAVVENFNIAKVWIEPGCIVCNACEDIYPAVFEVLADTCIIRPNPPLDDGIRMQDAAEACPVEVIKFTKAAS
jgi:ferredoxin